MIPTCETCQYWQNMNLLMPSVSGLGNCVIASSKRMVWNDILRTSKDFGCVEHEPGEYRPGPIPDSSSSEPS